MKSISYLCSFLCYEKVTIQKIRKTTQPCKQQNHLFFNTVNKTFFSSSSFMAAEPHTVELHHRYYCLHQCKLLPQKHGARRHCSLRFICFLERCHSDTRLTQRETHRRTPSLPASPQSALQGQSSRPAVLARLKHCPLSHSLFALNVQIRP